MRFIYNFGIYSYTLLIHFLSPLNKKAKLWVGGRKKVFTNLEKFKNASNKPIIWFHCASLGEFEQGRPIIEKVKKEKSEYRILLTFFSPSGFEVRKNYKGVDFVSYLPSDTCTNAKRFVDLISPDFVFFVKYEYWFNYINQLYLKKTPLFVVSAIFRSNQIFFKPYGLWFRKQLSKISFFYAQNDKSIELLKSMGIQNAIKSGDTRFDRVADISTHREQITAFSDIKKSNTIIVGSSWPDDEKLFINVLQRFPNVQLIIAPHEVHEERIKNLELLFQEFKTVRFSQISSNDISLYRVVVIDSIGLLSKIYAYGFMAYIGGGFGKGIHNTLEAACYGMPILFGPNYYKFQEAVSLIEEGAAFSIANNTDLCKHISEFLNSAENLEKTSEIAKNFVLKNKGATDVIFKHAFNET